DVRQMVLAVRQFVDKQVVPAAQGLDVTHTHPSAQVTALGEVGILGALTDPRHGGLGLDPRTAGMIVEELARGSAALAAIVGGHLAASGAFAGAGTPDQRGRFLPAMTRGELLGTVAFAPGGHPTPDGVRTVRAGDGWILEGETAAVDHAAHAGVVLVEARSTEGPVRLLVDPALSGIRVDPPLAMLGL